MTIDKVIEFAKENCYESAEYVGKWRGYDVYEPIYDVEAYKNNTPVYIGNPYVILVKDNKIRMSTEKEAFEYMDDTYDEDD